MHRYWKDRLSTILSGLHLGELCWRRDNHTHSHFNMFQDILCNQQVSEFCDFAGAKMFLHPQLSPNGRTAQSLVLAQESGALSTPSFATSSQFFNSIYHHFAALKPNLVPRRKSTCVAIPWVTFKASINLPSKLANPASNKSKRTSSGKRPYGYWKDLSNVLAELRAHLKLERINSASPETVMPTQTELLHAGRVDLAGGIRRHGWSKVANAAGLTLSSIARPRSLNLVYCTKLQLGSGRMRPYMYWRDFSNVREEVFGFMQQIGHTDLPTAQTLMAHKRSDLIRAIQKHGGWLSVSARLGIDCASVTRGRRPAKWPEFRDVAKEIRRVACLCDVEMPSMDDLNKHGGSGLTRAMESRFGGLDAVARRMRELDGDERRKLRVRRGNGYWQIEDNLKREVAESVRLACELDSERDPGIMITKRELILMGQSDVASALSRFGFRKAAAMCGFRSSR